MADLATLLGVQLQDKLGDIAAALPRVAGYLDQKGTRPANDVTPAEGERVLPDSGQLNRDGNTYYQTPNPAASYLPPAGGDRVVSPEKPLIAHRNGRAYLTAQVPVENEKGQIVDMVGPKGAPPIFQRGDNEAIVPIPNAPANALESVQAPYLTPKENKRKGLFIDHMKKMYGQMLEQIQNKYGIPT